MREFHFRLEKELLQGLKRTPYVEVNTFAKEDSKDFIVEDNALINFPYTSHTAKDTMFGDMIMFKKYGIVYDGYMPQIFRGKYVTLLNHYGLLYEIDFDAETLTPVSFEREECSNKRFEFIDMGRTWYLINEDYVIQCIDDEVTQYKIGIQTGLVFNNRFIFGGFVRKACTLDSYSMFNDLDDNSIWVSSVGGVYTAEQFKESIDNLDYLDRLDLIYTSVEGEIKKMISLGDSFLVGTTQAVYLCRILVGDVVTLSTNKVLSVGIKDKCLETIGGVPYLITTIGNLFVFDGNQFKDLKYSYLFKEYDNLFMVKDEHNRRLFVCNGDRSFLIQGASVFPLNKSISSIITI